MMGANWFPMYRLMSNEKKRSSKAIMATAVSRSSQSGIKKKKKKKKRVSFTRFLVLQLIS
jgi:hypothetical protein